MEGLVPGRRCKRPVNVEVTQSTEDTYGLREYEAERLATSRKSFVQTAKIARDLFTRRVIQETVQQTQSRRKGI